MQFNLVHINNGDNDIVLSESEKNLISEQNEY